MIICHPMMQAFHDHLLDNRVIAVHRIAAAGEVVIVALRCQHIVDIVVKALEIDERAILISLCRVVEYDIQDDHDACFMETADQLPELTAFPVVLLPEGVARVRRKVADRIVAPVIHKALAFVVAQVLHLIEFKDRHHLHRSDAKPFQIGDLLAQTLKSARRGNACICTHRKSTHMQLVDDQVFHIQTLIGMIAPVIRMAHDPRMVHALFRLPLSPYLLAGDSLCIDIQQDMVLVEQKSLLRIPRAVHAIGIFKLRDIKSEYNHRPHIPDPVILRKWNHRVWFLLQPPEQEQFYRTGSIGMDREADSPSISQRMCSVRFVQSRADGISRHTVPGLEHVYILLNVIVRHIFILSPRACIARAGLFASCIYYLCAPAGLWPGWLRKEGEAGKTPVSPFLSGYHCSESGR